MTVVLFCVVINQSINQSNSFIQNQVGNFTIWHNNSYSVCEDALVANFFKLNFVLFYSNFKCITKMSKIMLVECGLYSLFSWLLFREQSFFVFAIHFLPEVLSKYCQRQVCKRSLPLWYSFPNRDTRVHVVFSLHRSIYM